MDNPPENLPRPETSPSLANKEPASVPDTDDFAKRSRLFEAETRRRKKFILWPRVSLLSGVGIIALAFCFIGSYFGSNIAVTGLFVTVLALGAVFGVRFISSLLPPTSTTALLVRECNADSIGLLLARLDVHPSQKECELIWQTVIRLLNQITVDELDTLPRDVRARLDRHIITTSEFRSYTTEQFEFSLIWLENLKQIGDVREFYIVKSLMDIDEDGAAYLAIRGAARECLPHIYARIKAQETGKTLLRASSRPPDSGATLLRPAAQANPTAPKELLRPVEPEDEGNDSG